MQVFAYRYQIQFSDTMAYGTHHFLTNFKFQCRAREALLFLADSQGSEPWRTELAGCELLTRDGYTRNLSSLGLGEWAAVLLSAEEVGFGSFRLCFRVVASSGEPVACGHQQVVVVDRQTRRIAGIPAFIRARLVELSEPSQSSFADLAKRGGSALKSLFSDDLRALGQEIARGHRSLEANPFFSVLGSNWPSTETTTETTTVGRAAEPALDPAERQLVLVCAGQGALDAEWTLAVARALPGSRALLGLADEICSKHFSRAYSAWLQDGGRGEPGPQQTFREQLTLYLGTVFTGRLLLKREHSPRLLLGHSVGEIAAAVLGGALDEDVGLQVIAARTMALLRLRDAGALLVLQADKERASQLLERFPGLYLAVRNHSKQVVFAGRVELVQACRAAAAADGIAATVLPGFAFHSPLLLPAVGEFYAAIEPLRFRSAQIPIYSPMERRWLDTTTDPPSLWASHLIRSLDFGAAMTPFMNGRGYRFVECGRRGGLSRVLAALGIPRGSASNSTASELLPQDSLKAADRATLEPAARQLEEPLAIVAVGCCLPGAPDFEAYQALLDSGDCKIVDLRSVAPELALDFYSAPAGAADKTYTLLTGAVEEQPSSDAARPNQDARPRSSALCSTKIARLMASALAECRVSGDAQRSCVVVGTTADACGEYDEAVALERLCEAEPAVCAVVGDGPREFELGGGSRALVPRQSLVEVSRALLGEQAETLLVDAACASSLYALDWAARLLRERRSDLVYAGGAFAPGPSNNCLFAQFNGLARSGSYPLDQRAEGVVFGEGAAFVAVRRLADALQRGEPVLAVVRGVGLSSDGRSPSASTPKAAGQTLAVARAYERSGISPLSIQYLEAHATGTPVGDATELEALSHFFAAAGATPDSIRIGSVKSQISHVGWAAGVASILKVLWALKKRRFPAQHQLLEPTLKLAGSPFRLETTSLRWGENRDGEPRRAAVNGFGFGGANAHVILEEFDPRYHRAWAQPSPTPERVDAVTLLRVERPLATRDPAESWPKGATRLLPDVLETMDGSQWTAVMLAAECLESLEQTDRSQRQRIGVLVGMSGKTETIVRANDRVFRDRFLRRLGERAGSEEERRAIERAIRSFAEREPASTAYTLTGGMPNLVSGRVCQVFDLNGPNLTIDDGDNSFERALDYGRLLIADGTCDRVLTIGIDPRSAGTRRARAVLLNASQVKRESNCPEAEPDRASGAARETASVLHAAPRDAAAVVEFYHPTLISAEWKEPPRALGRKVWVVASDPALRERLGALLDVARYQVTAEIPAGIGTSAACERILLVEKLGGDPWELLRPSSMPERARLQPLLTLCKAHYALLERGALELGVICVDAWVRASVPRAETGLFGGFIKSLSRELPSAKLVAVHTDGRLEDGIETAEGALAGATQAAEIFVWQGSRKVHALALIRELSSGPALLGAHSVVLATGGARGITAELVELILEQFGCTVILLGRSDPEQTPQEFREKDPGQVSDAEGEFLRAAVARGSTLREAKRSFQERSAAHEALWNLTRFRKLPGRVVYQRCDLTLEDELSRTARRVAESCAGVDFVLHGAGVQTSSRLSHKSEAAFWATLDVKIGGLRNLLAALAEQFPERGRPQVHLSTSAFSYFGNDGQQDYGAANEALNRLAEIAALDESAPSWSSLAWLAWDAIGMTRGREYRALARTRNLRALSAAEGRALLLPLLAARPRHAAHVLSSASERERYQALVAPAASASALVLSVKEHPYLAQHSLRGCPLVPACILLDWMASEAERSSGLAVRGFERCEFLHAVRIPHDRTIELVVHWAPLPGDPQGLEAWVSGDVVTRVGQRLESDRCYARCHLIFGEHPLPAPERDARESGVLSNGANRLGRAPARSDPYLQPDSPIQLGAAFDCLRDLTVSPNGNLAQYRPRASESGLPGRRLPTLLLDALLRVGVIEASADVYLPTFIERIWLASGVNPALQERQCCIASTGTRRTADAVECASVVARSPEGEPLVVVRGYRGYRLPKDSLYSISERRISDDSQSAFESAGPVLARESLLPGQASQR